MSADHRLTAFFVVHHTLDSIGRRATISHRAHLCAGTHDHTKSDFPLLRPADHAGQRRHRLEHGRYQGRFNFREAGCHSTQPAPNPSIEALDKSSCCFLLRAAVEIVLQNNLSSDLIYLAARLPRLVPAINEKIPRTGLNRQHPFYFSSGSTDGFTHITSVNPAAPPGPIFWHG